MRQMITTSGWGFIFHLLQPFRRWRPHLERRRWLGGQTNEGLFRDIVETYRMERPSRKMQLLQFHTAPWRLHIIFLPLSWRGRAAISGTTSPDSRVTRDLKKHRAQGAARLLVNKHIVRWKTIISEKDFLEHLAKHSTPNHCFPLNPPLAAPPSETGGSCRADSWWERRVTDRERPPALHD